MRERRTLEFSHSGVVKNVPLLYMAMEIELPPWVVVGTRAGPTGEAHQPHQPHQPPLLLFAFPLHRERLMRLAPFVCRKLICNWF